MTLTPKQLETFKTEGYLVLRNFLASKDCEAILTKAKEHLDNKVEPLELETDYGKSSQTKRKDDTNYSSHSNDTIVRRLRQVYSRDIVFKHWMQNKKIRPILQQILNDDVVLTLAHHNSIMTKTALFSTQTSWHQDFRYWHFNNDNLVSIWLALGEENSQNGVLEFIPQSHKMVFKKEQFDEKEYFIVSSPLNKKLISTKITTFLEKGDVVFFHCKLLHRANKNSTNKTKISFVYTVKGASNKTIQNSRSSSFQEILLKNIIE